MILLKNEVERPKEGNIHNSKVFGNLSSTLSFSIYLFDWYSYQGDPKVHVLYINTLEELGTTISGC